MTPTSMVSPSKHSYTKRRRSARYASSITRLTSTRPDVAISRSARNALYRSNDPTHIHRSIMMMTRILQIMMTITTRALPMSSCLSQNQRHVLSASSQSSALHTILHPSEEGLHTHITPTVTRSPTLHQPCHPHHPSTRKVLDPPTSTREEQHR